MTSGTTVTYIIPITKEITLTPGEMEAMRLLRKAYKELHARAPDEYHSQGQIPCIKFLVVSRDMRLVEAKNIVDRLVSLGVI